MNSKGNTLRAVALILSLAGMLLAAGPLPVRAADEMEAPESLDPENGGCTNSGDGCPGGGPPCGSIVPCPTCLPQPGGGPGSGGGGSCSGFACTTAAGASGGGPRGNPHSPFTPRYDSAGKGGDHIDGGHHYSFQFETDFVLPLSGGMEFNISRLYSSGPFPHTVSDTVYSGIGTSWQLSYDCRLFNEEGASNRLVFLPNGRVRTLVWNESENRWKSMLGQGYAAILTLNESVYTLEQSDHNILRFDIRGYLKEWENPAGYKLTFEHESTTYSGKTIYRLKHVYSPSVDGMELEFTYDATRTYLIDKIDLKKPSVSYSQTVVDYTYYTSGNSAWALKKATLMDEERGSYYEYGTWNPSTETVDSFTASDDRTLAGIGVVVPSASPIIHHAISYRTGAINVEGSSGYEPHVEYHPVYGNASNLNQPTDWQFAYGYSYVPGWTETATASPTPTPGGTVGNSWVGRVYKGSYEGPYTSYYGNGNRDVYIRMSSEGYQGMDHARSFNLDNRMVTEVFVNGIIPTYTTPTPTQNARKYTLTYTTSESDHLRKGNPSSVTDDRGRTWQYNSYDSTWNKPTQFTDAFGRTTTTSYNATHGKVEYVTLPNGQTIDYVYNGYGNLTSVVDSLASTTSYSYYNSGQGRLQTITNPDGSTVTYEYNTMGLTWKVTPSNGPIVEYTYTKDRVTSVKVGNDTTSYTYDAFGRKTSVTDPTNKTTEYTYDGIGQLVGVTAHDDSYTSFSYDLYGNMTKFLDPEGNLTEYGYDGANRLNSTTRWDDTNSRYLVEKIYYGDTNGCSCCANKNSIASTSLYDGTNITWKAFEYDDYGRVTSVKYYATKTYNPNYPLDMGTLKRTVAYQYNHTVNGKDTDLVTKISDSGDEGLPFSDKDYEFTYNSNLLLTKIIHPQDYYEEFFYDNRWRMEKRRDVDGGITSITLDSLQRLSQLTNPWGKATNFYYNGSGDPGPRGTLKELAYANGAKAQYTYDSLSRLDVLTNKNASGGTMTAFDYTYSANGNITRIDLTQDGTTAAWAYTYDDLNRLTKEERRNASDAPLWHRAYAYDDAGNRTQMQHYDGSQTYTTNYTYNDLNQLISRDVPSQQEDDTYSYDSFGNLSAAYVGGSLVEYGWTLDNRLKTVVGVQYTQFAYDYQGARILRRDDDGTRTRYFFRGLTEEVVKTSVKSSPSDDDFTFSLKEDGESASDWAVYDNDPPGATVTSADDSARHPYQGGVATGNVIKCVGADGNGFAIGDNDAESWNANGTAWNDTRRVLSFWYKGGTNPLYVICTTSLGTRYVSYHTYGGTDYVDGNYIKIYLGTGAASSTQWLRFERDVKADFERVAGGGATWTNTDGVLIRPSSTMAYDFWIDDIRLSNCKTLIHNSLTGGAIGQIACSREVTATGGNGSLGLTDTWYHYDHIGNVMNHSNSSGAMVSGSIQHQDAWGNVLASATTGAWTGFSGRHLTTKEYDPDAGLYYFYARQYAPQLGRFISMEPLLEPLPRNSAFRKLAILRPDLMWNAYLAERGNPVQYVDADGEFAFLLPIVIGAIGGGISCFLDEYVWQDPKHTAKDCMCQIAGGAAAGGVGALVGAVTGPTIGGAAGGAAGTAVEQMCRCGGTSLSSMATGAFGGIVAGLPIGIGNEILPGGGIGNSLGGALGGTIGRGVRGSNPGGFCCP